MLRPNEPWGSSWNRPLEQYDFRTRRPAHNTAGSRGESSTLFGDVHARRKAVAHARARPLRGPWEARIGLVHAEPAWPRGAGGWAGG